MKTRLLTIGMSLLCGIGVPGAQTPQPAPAPQPLAAQEELRAQGEHPAREALPAQGEPPQWGGAQHGGDEIRPLDDSLALMELLYGEPLTLPGDWLGQSGNPFARKEREQKQLQQMRERARASVLSIPRLSNDLVNRNGFRWRMTVGYLPMNNWSPYEDRWLDARIIRMPLPRNMRPDKRPLAEQRRDALRKARR